MKKIRTRFAPSPTGFLHIGSARTALFAFAFARKNDGEFILRVEDTDILRSTEASIQSILEAMDWLGLNYDAGPFYQTKRMDRYKEVLQQLLDSRHAYYCYCSKEELDEMREQQKQNGLKPKYDRRCLHNQRGGNSEASPVIRFKNPDGGSVIWDDLVKGRIEIANQELDDLIIARADGTPTYNFCVVVDDLDMQITHVIRGDDHVNNTPRQINIFEALGAEIPLYAHTPMILRDDGQKMSKRHDAVSVMQYKDMGILPEALLNYLARLCWGHGDDELFSKQQFIQWFDLSNVSASPARFDIKKLYWVNSEHIKMQNNLELGELVKPLLEKQGALFTENTPNLEAILQFVKARVDNLNALANECIYFYKRIVPQNIDTNKILTAEALEILRKFTQQIMSLNQWTLDAIKAMIKEFCISQDIKMPQLGMPLRLKLCGTTQTPSFDNIIYLLGQNEVLARLTTDI